MCIHKIIEQNHKASKKQKQIVSAILWSIRF